MESATYPKNDRKEIFGWLTYDWANSVFSTTVVGVLVGDYITVLAQKAVGENGVVIALGGYDLVTAKSVFSYSVGLSVFLQIFFLPILGAIADYTNLKKTFMASFCFLGAFTCCLLFFVQGDLYLLGCLFFLVANLSFGAAVVFYNSFLPDITTVEQRDKVSSWGFAAGYISGFLVLLGNLYFLRNCEQWGIDVGTAVRLCFLFSGIWWGAFSLVTFLLLKQRQPERPVPEGKSYISAGIGELKDTFKQLWHLKHTLRFLIAYLLYNDGIQTVITASSIFLSQELFVSRGIETDRTVLITAFLIAQFVAFFGAMIFERIAHFTNAKTAILGALLIWSCIVIYAYGFLTTVIQAYAMSGMIGFVLGGSQALSRSLFSKMIPPGKESSFFGIYEISERGTSWMGPVVFGLVAQLTNSYRPALLALIIFFVVGSLILLITNTDQAIRDASSPRYEPG